MTRKTMLPNDYLPEKPFPDFKWRWASKECTEGLNEPLILLGVLYRLHKLEDRGLAYSSKEFAREMRQLEQEIQHNLDFRVKLSSRTGDRNLMRNSKQYWTSFGLVENAPKGLIRLTKFGRDVASHNVSQTEFAAIAVQSRTLPNAAVMSAEECSRWNDAGLVLHPLKLLLEIMRKLYATRKEEAYITRDELCNVVIPLSGTKSAEVGDFVRFILSYRRDSTRFENWPDCCPDANDRRIAREYLLFLSNYGYATLTRDAGQSNATERFRYCGEMDDEIGEIIGGDAGTLEDLWQSTSGEAAAEFERKRVRASYNRPNQARFRSEVLSEYKHCLITNVEMPEVLEAGHIVPHAYHGEDTIANGIPLRSDIHTLFDTGNLRISPDGEVCLSDKARINYGFSIPKHIELPAKVDREFVRWRWENYSGL